MQSSAAPASKPATPAIQARELAAAPVAAAGSLTPDQAGLPADIWIGAKAEHLVRFVDLVQPGPVMAANDLMRRVLLVRAEVPEGAGAALLVARLQALGRLGSYDAVRDLGRMAGVAAAAGSSAFVDAMLVAGREAEVCPHALQHKGLDPERRAYCLAVSGQKPQALTEIAFARDQGKASPALELIEAIADPTLAAYVESETVPPSLMTVLAARQLKKPLPKGWAEAAQKLADPGLAALGLEKGNPPRMRLTIAEKLAARGATEPEPWLELVAEFPSAESGGVWGRVEAIRAVNRLSGTAQANAVANAMRGAAEAGTEVLMAQMIAQDAARLEPGLETSSIQPLMRRLFLLADRPQDAAPYLPVDADALSRALDRVADPAWVGVWDGSDLQALLTRRKQGDARANLMLAALAGLELEPGLLPDYASDASAALTRLVQEGQKGMVVLSALTLLVRDQGPKTLAAVVHALRGIGLEAEARRIAVQLLLR